MRTLLILTIGIPGSGKSTWAKNYQEQNPGTIIISTDEIRKEQGETVCNPEHNNAIHEEARRRVKDIFDHPEKYNYNDGLGPEVIVDSTNVDLVEWIKYKELNPTILAAKVFDVDVDDAYDRQEARGRVVPLDVLEDKYYSLQANKPLIPHFFNILF